MRGRGSPVKGAATTGLALLAALTASFAQNVSFTDRTGSVVLDNGIVSAEIAKRSGDILVLHYRGLSLMAAPASLDWVAGGNNHIRAGQFSLRTDPSTNGGEMAEVCIAQKWSGNGAAFDVELHHILRRGDSGVYTYVVFSHPQGYPAAEMAQSRMVLRLRDDLFDFINIDDQRRRSMPPTDTPVKELGPKESMQVTAGPFKGVIEDKYHNFADAGEHFVHGWSGAKTKIGCWILYGSTEDQNGGPTKQHNTAHFGRILLKILTCGHYGAAGVNVDAEAWSKIYGPWMIYVNGGGDTDALWDDAKRKAATERAAWPYAWMNHPLYPLSGDRGTVRGRLEITDPQDPSASSGTAWVGLAAPKPDWQQQSLGYQFWVRAAKDGSFAIPKIRPGDYTLYAFVDGVMGEFRHDGVTVAKSKTADLGTLNWKPVRYGNQLWQIGTPDRTSKEFRHGDDYRQWGLWLNYPQEFSNDVNFVIGKSRERTDWNYAQVTVLKNGEWVGTKWNILFDLPRQLPPGTATLRIAFAAAHKANLRVVVNDKDVADFGVGTDNAMIRAGIHGQYSERDVRFDAALLKPARNTISLQQRAGGSNQKNVMYDCLRLEFEPSPANASR